MSTNAQEIFSNQAARNAALSLASITLASAQDKSPMRDLAKEYLEFLIPHGPESAKDREKALQLAILNRDRNGSNNVFELAEQYLEFVVGESEQVRA